MALSSLSFGSVGQKVGPKNLTLFLSLHVCVCPSHMTSLVSPLPHRCSSIQLLGDLLYKISGLSGKMSTESEEDDNFGTEAAHQVLLRSLGRERRDRVFAGLYMGR